MLKWLAILGFCAGALFGTGVVAGQPNQTANGKGNSAGQGEPAVVSANGHDKQDASQTNQPKASGNAPDRNTAFKWPAWVSDSNWWLLIVAGFTGGVIAWQSFETKLAAEAALLNARAIIDAERAWIVISVEEEFAPIADDQLGMSAARILEENNRRAREAFLTGTDGKPKVFYISCLNQGRTPARIVSVCSTYRFVDKPENLPSPPDYSAATRMPEQTFIVSRDSFKIQPGFSPGTVWENARKNKSLKANDLFLIFYGRVVYEDIFAFGEPTKRVQRESRWSFCCFMDSDHLPTRSGPGEYDRYT